MRYIQQMRERLGLRGVVGLIIAVILIVQPLWSLVSNEPLFPFLLSRLGDMTISAMFLSLLSALFGFVGVIILAIILATIRQTPHPVSASASDALEHIVVKGQEHLALGVHEGRPGWPVVYPIQVRNTRPMAVNVIAYIVTILLNQIPAQTVKWQAPSRFADNGLGIAAPFESQEPLEALPIGPDANSTQYIPVNIAKIHPIPSASPLWGARGEFTLRCGNESRRITFDLTSDNYKLESSKWAELINHAHP